MARLGVVQRGDRMVSYSLSLFVIALVSGLVPLAVKRSDRILHLLVALSTGLFLGVIFLHLLPELSVLSPPEAGHDEHDHASAPGPWLFVLVGLLAVYLLEQLVFGRAHDSAHRPQAPSSAARCQETHHYLPTANQQHMILGYAAFLGLGVHAFTAGLAFGAVGAMPDLTAALFLAIVTHKGAEGFSLSTVFMLAGFGVRKLVSWLAAFALITPLGITVGSQLAAGLGSYGLSVVTALAAGTFLYVAVCDLLPEVFHHRVDAVSKVVLIAVGIVMSSLIHMFDHQPHI